VLLFKGAALLLTSYPAPGLRPMVDLDVLVTRDAVAGAAELLRRRGWASVHDLTPGFLRTRHAAPFNAPEGRQCDLHWTLFEEHCGPQIDAACWAASRVVDLRGAPVRVLAPTDQLLHIVIHGTRWARTPSVRWVANVLPRIELLRLAGVDLSTVDAFIVNRVERPFQHETLVRLGLGGARLIFADERFHARADLLLVTSSLRFSGHRTPAVLAFLRREFLTANESAVVAPARLYVSREDARRRRLVNEAECLDVLRPLGFEKATLTGLPVQDQAALFSRAEAIVAPHGAGLANLVFCRRGTTVVELGSAAELRSHYLELSRRVGLEHHCVIGEPTGSQRDFRVRPADLARALRSARIGQA
jgi:capsular polysaccharide biosynthesis protein